MFVHFNVSEYFLSIKANIVLSRQNVYQMLMCNFFHDFISMQQTSVQGSWFGTV